VRAHAAAGHEVSFFTPLPSENSALRWQYTHDAPEEDPISSRSQLPIMLLV